MQDEQKEGEANAHPLVRCQADLASKVVQVGDELLKDELLPVKWALRAVSTAKNGRKRRS